MRKYFLFLMALSVSLAIIAGDKLSAPTRVFLQQHAKAVAQAPNGKSVLASPKTVNGVEYVECFITLNAVYLGGDKGLIEQLRAAGYRVRPVNRAITIKN